ncbi:Hypothetical protein W5S_1184 [Pectobacterium parmentieri]|uniref:Uncharacterized protein n=1 Tax=Pectobacterium parmentieri TaxID=1905730 RepID=A0A0H3I0R5_PECPM|nr:Hypothetical protein W5S_1184 [Pectobacterium parmentieri]
MKILHPRHHHTHDRIYGLHRQSAIKLWRFVVYVPDSQFSFHAWPNLFQPSPIVSVIRRSPFGLCLVSAFASVDDASQPLRALVQQVNSLSITLELSLFVKDPPCKQTIIPDRLAGT